MFTRQNTLLDIYQMIIIILVLYKQTNTFSFHVSVYLLLLANETSMGWTRLFYNCSFNRICDIGLDPSTFSHNLIAVNQYMSTN